MCSITMRQYPVTCGPKRYHALESLRAWMMLLGLWFHASCSYTTLPIVWIYKDPATSRLLDAPLLLLHVFRMPIFFLLAGFFARFSWQRSGTTPFLRNRAKRILLPFAVSWPILFIVSRAGYVYGLSLHADRAGLPMWEYFRSGQVLGSFRT